MLEQLQTILQTYSKYILIRINYTEAFLLLGGKKSVFTVLHMGSDTSYGTQTCLEVFLQIFGFEASEMQFGNVASTTQTFSHIKFPIKTDGAGTFPVESSCMARGHHAH